MSEFEQINRALATLHSNWSSETEQAIADSVSPEVAATARAIYEDAMRCPVDWRTATMDSALQTLATYLQSKYPWLSDDARRSLNYCFIMAWK